MTLRSLFDKDRRKDIQRALVKGEPLPFQRRKDSEPPSAPIPFSEVSVFILGIRNSSGSTNEKLDNAIKFLKCKSSGLVTTHGHEASKVAEASAREKQRKAEQGEKVTYTLLEETILGLIELAKVIEELAKREKSEDEVRTLLGTRGKVGP